MKNSTCTICKSVNTTQWYPENINFDNIKFTYEFSPESQKTFRVVRCQNCTHVFCAPIPKNIYKNYVDVVDNEYLRHSKTRELSAREVLKTIKQYSHSGLLLDVGCATGDFLQVATEFDYRVEGLELSSWSSKISRKRGHKIYNETLKSLSQKYSNKYDVITLWGVIEHFENPREEMGYLYRLLKPNGIVALWTGDVDALISRVLGRKWWYWQGQHIQYFTHQSLNTLATENGFEHKMTKIYPIAATYEQMENSLSRYRFQNFILPFIKLAFRLRSVWYLRLPGEMFWIARKKN